MFKKILISLVAAGFLLTAYQAQAQHCGGSLIRAQDTNNSNRPWHISCCPSGSKAHGIACADLPPDQDYGDGCSAYCRSSSGKENMQHSNDFQREALVYKCKSNEKMVGIACKDYTGKKVQKDSDIADGCTAICKSGGSTRTVHSADLSQNPREWKRVTSGGKTIVGIACKDLQKGSTDKMDGCTIIVK